MKNSNGFEILKSLNQKFAKGVSKYPRRSSDFAVPQEKKYPLYPITRWIETVQTLSKSEVLEKLDNPVEIINRIIAYRDNNYKTPDMAKSTIAEYGVHFTISGSKIKSAVEIKVKMLKMELELAKQSSATSIEDGIIETDYLIGTSPTITSENKFDYQTNELKRKIEDMEAIARNIDTKKTFKISDWDLSKYGL